MEDRLQKFARLTEVGSFTKAARELHISQPALSIAIDKLERELGAELLVRGNRKLALTAAGKAAYWAAQEHQNTTDHLKAELSKISKRRPTVSIGLIDSLATSICSTQAFDALEAAADVTLVVNNSRYLCQRVAERQLDAALVIESSSDQPTLIMTPFGSEELVFVCHPEMYQVARADLQQGRVRNFICYDKPSNTFRHIHQALKHWGIKPHISLFSTSPDIMLSLALRGRGVTALPRLLVQRYIQSGQLVALDYVVERPVTMVQLAGKQQPVSLANFFEAIRAQSPLC